jgi:hypothetical protein
MPVFALELLFDDLLPDFAAPFALVDLLAEVFVFAAF